MPIYKISAPDLAKIKADPQYGFLHENSKMDHGTHWTITLSNRSRDMLVERLGIEAQFVHAVEHGLTLGTSGDIHHPADLS